MRRIAFFVEGQTEQIFVNRLAKDILGVEYTNIIQKQYSGGVNVPKQEIVRSLSLSRSPRYEILIINCGADNRVKSEIMENLINLRERGYEKIVGVRDLYPLPIDDLERLEKGLRFLPNHLKDEAAYFDVIVAVHEIETWFLAETSHFKKVDKRLTGHFIRQHLNFNPFTDDMTQREHPAKDLDDIYRLVGKSYTKRYWQVSKLVNRLDYRFIRTDLRYNIPALDKLICFVEKIKKGTKGRKR